MKPTERTDAFLLMDTCGERALLALFRGDRLSREALLEERTASAALLGAVRELLRDEGLRLDQLAGLGVVHGPGSFTGLRVGLAVAKGLCEATATPVAAVSRLAVLMEAGKLQDGFAVLRAGRDVVYVREKAIGAAATERMMTLAELRNVAADRSIVYAEDELTSTLEGLLATRIELLARDAFELAHKRLHDGGDDLLSLDANYVRDEQAIYTRQQGRA